MLTATAGVAEDRGPNPPRAGASVAAGSFFSFGQIKLSVEYDWRNTASIANIFEGIRVE
jgi:hypothetical protein